MAEFILSNIWVLLLLVTFLLNRETLVCAMILTASLATLGHNNWIIAIVTILAILITIAKIHTEDRVDPDYE